MDEPIRMVLRSTGDAAQPQAFARMSVKVPGRHRWIGLATYALSDEQARLAHEGGPVLFEIEMLAGFSIGCLDCEGPYETVFTQRCLSPEFDWDGAGP